MPRGEGREVAVRAEDPFEPFEPFEPPAALDPFALPPGRPGPLDDARERVDAPGRVAMVAG